MNMNSVHLRKINETSKNMIFQPTYPSVWGAGSQRLISSSGHKAGPTLDRTLVYYGAIHTHTDTHTHRLEQCRHTSSLHMHISGMWEDTWGPGENPRRHGENIQTPHGQWLWWESIFSSVLKWKDVEQQNIIQGLALVTFERVEALVLRNQVNTS